MTHSQVAGRLSPNSTAAVSVAGDNDDRGRLHLFGVARRRPAAFRRVSPTQDTCRDHYGSEWPPAASACVA